MERISVFHGKLSYPYKSAPRSRFVSEFGLNLIYHKREIRIRLRGVAGKLYCGFFVRHTEYEFISASVGKPCHFAAYTRISAGFFP